MNYARARKITENCPTVPIHYLHRLANFTAPGWCWSRHARYFLSQRRCIRIVYVSMYGMYNCVVYGVYNCVTCVRENTVGHLFARTATRGTRGTNERTNLRFHRILSLIAGICVSGLYGRPNSLANIPTRFNETLGRTIVSPSFSP